MNRCALREWIPILPLPVCPLAWQFPLGQKTVVGSIMLLLAVRGSVLRGVCLDPIFVTSELHHGLVQSYLSFVGLKMPKTQMEQTMGEHMHPHIRIATPRG